jgi:hypothetical protein
MDIAPLLLKQPWELSLVEIWTLIKECFNWLLNQPVWIVAIIVLGFMLISYLYSKWGWGGDAYKRDSYRDQYK